MKVDWEYVRACALLFLLCAVFAVAMVACEVDPRIVTGGDR